MPNVNASVVPLADGGVQIECQSAKGLLEVEVWSDRYSWIDGDNVEGDTMSELVILQVIRRRL